MDALAPVIDARAIADTWLIHPASALFTRSEPDLQKLFDPPAALRASLVFSWDIRAPGGPAAIAAHLCTKGGASQGLVRGFALDERIGLASTVADADQPGAVSLAFTFATPFRKGRVIARLFPRRHYGDDGPEG